MSDTKEFVDSVIADAVSEKPKRVRLDCGLVGNVEVISHRANFVKNDGTAAEHLTIYKRMTERGLR